MKRTELDFLLHYFQDVRIAISSREMKQNRKLFQLDVQLLGLLAMTNAKRVKLWEIHKHWEIYRAFISLEEYASNPWLSKFICQFERKLSEFSEEGNNHECK